MDSRTTAPSFFSQPITNDEALEILSAINILVYRTRNTGYDCYEGCLEYLRSHMSRLRVQDLCATQPKYEPHRKDSQRERYLLYVNLEDWLVAAAEIDADYISEQSVARDILFPDVSTRAYVLGDSAKYKLIGEHAELLIHYVEDRSPYPLDPAMFHQVNIAAAIIIHDPEVKDIKSLKNIYLYESRRIYERYGVTIVHLLCRGPKGFFLFDLDTICYNYPWLKYNRYQQEVRIDTGVEGFSNHTISYTSSNDMILLYESTEKMHYILRELAMHCVVCVLRGFVAKLETEVLPELQLLSSYDNPNVLWCMSRKQKNNFALARTHKTHGDILMMLNNIPQASALYFQAKNRCTIIGDLLFKGAAGFCLAVTLVYVARLKEQRNMEARRLAARRIESRRLEPKYQYDSTVSSRSYASEQNKGKTLNTEQSVSGSVGDPEYTCWMETNSTPQKMSWFPFIKSSSRRVENVFRKKLISEGKDALDNESGGYESGEKSTRQYALEIPEGSCITNDAQRSTKNVPTDYGSTLDKDEERVLRTFTKAFLRWLTMETLPKYEFEVMFLIFLHYMQESGYCRRLHYTISRMIEYAERQLSMEENINFLRYIIDFTKHTQYIRKWNYYKFLYDNKILEGKDPASQEVIDYIVGKYMLRPRIDTDNDSTVINGNYTENKENAGLDEVPKDVLSSNMNAQCVYNERTDMRIKKLCKAYVIPENARKHVYSLTPDICLILEDVMSVICSPFVAGEQVQYTRQVGWRVTKFFEIQHAYIEMAIKQCEQVHKYHEIAQLSFINMMIAVDQLIMMQSNPDNLIGKMESCIEIFRNACRYLSRSSKMDCFRLNHVIFSQDLRKKIKAIDNRQQRFTGYRLNHRGLFRVCNTDNSLIHHCGGYAKSSHALPLVVAMDYVDIDKEDDNIVHVKPRDEVVHSHRNHYIILRSDYIFKLKGISRYRSTCICNFTRWTGNTASARESITPSAVIGPLAPYEGPLKSQLTNIGSFSVGQFEPKCVVLNRISSRNVKCMLVKREGDKIIRPQPPDFTKTDRKTRNKRPTQSQYETKYIDKDSLQSIIVRFNNPLPVKMLLEDLTLLTVGAKADVIRVHVPIKPMQKDVKVTMRFIPRELGELQIVGVGFTLFESITCKQIFLNVPVANASRTMDDISLESWEFHNKVVQLLEGGSALTFKVRSSVYRPVVSYYPSQPVFRQEEQCFTDRSIDRSTIISPRSEIYSQRTQGRRSSIPPMPSLSPRTVSIQECYNSMRAAGGKVASLPQTVYVCPLPSCMTCCSMRNVSRELVATESVKVEIIEGEEKLIVLRVHNDSTDITMKNIRVSVIPMLYEPDEPTALMTFSDRELARRKQRRDITHKEATLVRNFTVLANRATVMKPRTHPLDSVATSMSSSRSQTYAWSLASRRKEAGEIPVIEPGETLHVPILYRATARRADYKFCVDYDYESQEGPVRAAIFKSLSLSILKGVSIGKLGIDIKPYINFSVDELLTKFNVPYQPSTMKALRTFKRIFDDRDVKVMVDVINGTDKPFICSSKGFASFVSVPHTEATWEIRTRRLNYVEAKYMHPTNFLRAMDRYMVLQWELDQSHGGELRISDLVHKRSGREGASTSPKKSFSKKEYKKYILSQHRKVAIWKNNAAGMPLSIVKSLRVPTAIHCNLHHIVESQISLDLTVSIGGVVYSSEYSGEDEECSITVGKGVPFKLTVLARNNGDMPIENYLTVILPFRYGTCCRPKGLSWVGSLEQIGAEPLLPAEPIRSGWFRPIFRGDTLVRVDGTSRSACESYERHNQVAHLLLSARETMIYGITAAVIVKRAGGVYWHSRPLVVQVVPQ
ncbi:hypothetical protein BgAZ_401800 [Babesia gibsoni]|uniref:Uncharacterized protein n=1 Tax=Babesia gibsoni TaxID=33632 RepID=A0AAD8LRB5_BABGI|nr:hypothetical protein BgAZ_401800 [Babesia gibsoni]